MYLFFIYALHLSLALYCLATWQWQAPYLCVTTHLPSVSLNLLQCVLGRHAAQRRVTCASPVEARRASALALLWYSITRATA